MKMKFFLGILAFLVVSAFAIEIKPKPLEFKVNKRYAYGYAGRVFTGIPSASNLYSGTELSAVVTISHIVNKNGVHLNTMQLSLINFGQFLGELTDPSNSDDIKFGELDDSNAVNKEILGLTVQYHVNNETGRFEWIEVDKRDEPWSLNIKKSIIEMFLVDVAGQQLKMNSDHDFSRSKGLHDEVHHAFDVYEPTLKGECETMYQVNNYLPESVHGLSGLEKFYWKVMKTRNYENCYNESVLTHHNYARSGCGSTRTSDKSHDQLDKSQCSCKRVDVEPLDQQLTSTYFIESMDYPYIVQAESNGKIVFDNHGTRFISYTKQNLKFIAIIAGDPVNHIKKGKAIRVANLTFTLNPYTGSSAKVFTHEIPIYNLLVPVGSYPKQEQDIILAVRRIRVLMDQVIETVTQGRDFRHRNVTRYMTKVIQDLSHIDDPNEIRLIFQADCVVKKDQIYTNTHKSVARQLFLDAISHVGTQTVLEWLQKAISEEGDLKLYPNEIRQLIETLPLNVYAPTKSLIRTVEVKFYYHMARKDWDSLSAYALSYGKLIAKVCPNPEPSSERKAETSKERCTVKDTFEYIDALARSLKRINSIRGKVLIAQALAHTGKSLAFEALTPYAKGEFKCPFADVSDCIYLRTSIVYSFLHLRSVGPKRVRSLVLPIFNSNTEPYELRLAALTVFMSAEPEKYELDSIAVSLRKETNLQVISLARSMLEETANLKNPCDQQLAQNAREIIATLPEINLDGVYSSRNAKYSEWYSTDKSTGLFAEAQFIANNVSYIPRHGYLAVGSHWKSMSNPWFSFAWQQKGLETALKHLQFDLKSMARDPRKIDDLWRDLEIESRDEEDFMLKLFVRVYEQHSLFTLDKNTLKNVYKQFLNIMHNFVSDASNNKVDFNLVRFFMPSTYTDVLPTAIGLPIMAVKQNPQIISLRITKSDLQIARSNTSFTFKITPHIFTSSDASLAVFNQGLKTKLNYGVHASKKLNLFIPVDIGFDPYWLKQDSYWKYNLQYAIKPDFDKVNLHSSNTNFAFTAKSYIGLGFGVTKSINEKMLIQSLVPSYKHPMIQLKSPKFGMSLNVNMTSERPWFLDLTSIPCDGTVAWLLEKYNELNQFNHEINLSIVKPENSVLLHDGLTGSLGYDQDFDGKFVELGRPNPTTFTQISYNILIGKQLTQSYPIHIQDPAFFARTLYMTINVHGQVCATRLTLVRAVDYQAYWYRYTSSWTNLAFIPFAIFKPIPQLTISGKLERSILPSDLKWRFEDMNTKGLVASYITDIEWNEDQNKKDDSKISIKGLIRRSPRDLIIPEMERESWFHEQCEKDIENGQAANYACERLATQQSHYNFMTGKIELKKVGKGDRESIRKVYSELKRSLINYWKPWSTISIKDDEANQDIVTFEAAYSNLIDERPLINLFVQTPTEKVNFTKLFVPVAPFPTLLPMEYLKASSLPKDQTCTVMKDSIRTFDNVTYRTWIDECEYVVAMDCSKDNKRFAVTVKGKAGERSMRVYPSLQIYLEIKNVTKDSASLQIYDIHDEKQSDYILKSGLPVIDFKSISETIQYHEAHQIFMQDGVVNVILPAENVRVAFDGYYLKVTTSPLYIGKTCGLCGNQNQEYKNEFLDPKMNDLTSNLTAFRDSYSLYKCKDQFPCREPEQCASQNFMTKLNGRSNNVESSTLHTSEKNEYGIYRTLFERRGNSVCFSKHPQIVCKEGQKAKQTETRTIDLVCFTDDHPLIKQWIEMVKKRVITELTQMPATESIKYKEPLECEPIDGLQKFANSWMAHLKDGRFELYP